MNSLGTVDMKTYELIGILVVGFIALFPFLMALLGLGLYTGRLSSSVRNSESECKALRDKVHDLSNAFMAHRQEVATDYVRHGAIEKLEGRLMEAIHGLGKRIDDALTTRGKEP